MLVFTDQMQQNSNNKYLYSLSYSPELNPIENLFSQLKNYVRQESPKTYIELNRTIKNVINKTRTYKKLF